jgi:hypothetical protein
MKSDNHKGHRTPTKDLSDRRSVSERDDMIVRYIAEGSISGFPNTARCMIYNLASGGSAQLTKIEHVTRVARTDIVT